MAAQVTILTGSAGTGKTSRALERYRQVLGQGPPGSALWIAPTRRSAADVRSRLLDEGLSVCFSPNVFTFAGFAQQIVDSNGADALPLSEVTKRILIGRIVADMNAEGRLEHFAPIADRTGLVELLARFIGELKRTETWPEQFLGACSLRGDRPKDRELAEIYERYQDLLTRLGLFDAEGRFWAARDLLDRGCSRPHEAVQFVVVDGFTDFTHTQYDILALLAGRSQEVLITLPLETPIERPHLFARSEQTLVRLRECLAPHSAQASERREEEPARVPTDPDQNRRRRAQQRPVAADVHFERLSDPAGRQAGLAALGHLERNLFGNPRRKQQAGNAEGIEVLAASGQLGEVRLLAGRIKELLQSGVPAADVVVTFRHLEPYAPLVDEVFPQYGVPYSLEAGVPLSQIPAMAALVAIVRLDQEDWPFRQLTAMLRNNYVDPRWPEWTRQSLRDSDRLLRSLAIPAGRQHYVRALERVAHRQAERREPGETSASTPAAGDPQSTGPRAAPVLALLQRLGECLDRFPRRTASLAEWTEALYAVAEDVGFVRALQGRAGDLAERDLAAWFVLKRALDEWVSVEGLLARQPPALNGSRFLKGLKQLLGWEQIAPALDETGRVRVLSAFQTRALRVPYLFVGGMAERGFPAPHTDDALLGESERQELNGQGLALSNRTATDQEEMLLFYSVVTRAADRLVFGFPGLDDKGEPLLPSPYLDEALNCFTDEAREGIWDRRDQLDPIPPRKDLFTAADVRIRATAEALDGRRQLLAGLRADDAFGEIVGNVLATFDVARARFQERQFGPFDGLLLSEKAKREIRARFGSQRALSPSQLEQYWLCPFRFLLANVLNVSELEVPEVGVDAARRGSLAHRALARLHRRLNARNDGPCSPGSLELDKFLVEFRHVVDEVLGPNEGAEVNRALSELERQLLEQWGRNYYDQQSRYDAERVERAASLRPAHFEVAFGMEETHGEEPDPLSTPKPLVVRDESEAVHLCGRVDRIDVGPLADRKAFTVIDYKTGAQRNNPLQEVRKGEALQLILYTMAVESLLLERQNAIPLEAGYWFLREKRGFAAALTLASCSGGTVTRSAEWPELRSQVEQRVLALARGIRGGLFPVSSRDAQCTTFCPYRTACRVNQVRPIGKPWELPSAPETA